MINRECNCDNKVSCRRLVAQKHPPEVFYKKDVLKNFTKFTGKHLYRGLFFNKVVGPRLQNRL